MNDSLIGYKLRICQKCHNRSGDRVAHHLNGYHWHIDGRYNINNLFTLCKQCHKKFHKEFGMQYNTKAQFYEFIVV